MIGPLADQTHYLLGNYRASPRHCFDPRRNQERNFQTRRLRLARNAVSASRRDGGSRRASNDSRGQAGTHSTVLDRRSLQRETNGLCDSKRSNVNFQAGNVPADSRRQRPDTRGVECYLTPTETADYSLGLRMSGGFARLEIDDKPTAQGWAGSEDGLQTHVGHVHLEGGKKVRVKVDFSQGSAGPGSIQLIWSKYDASPSPEALEAAAKADVVVAVLGITSELEGEEMPVSEPGFKGGDRTVSICRGPKRIFLKLSPQKESQSCWCSRTVARFR